MTRAASEPVPVAAAVPGRRIPAVEGLRGLAMLLVFLFHLNSMVPVLRPGVSRAYQDLTFCFGGLGTDCFMLLSGMFIFRTVLRGPLEPRLFLTRRLYRIYPVYLATLALHVAVILVIPSMSRLPANPAYAVAYLVANASIVSLAFGVTPVITVTWTLGFIVLYYLLCPAAVELTGMRLWTPRRRAVALTCAALGWYAIPVLPARMAVFFWGAALSPVVNVPSRVQRLLWCGVVAGLGARFFFFHQRLQAAGAASLSAAASALVVICVYGLVLSPGLFSSLCAARPLRLLGRISYSYYVTQGLSCVLIKVALAQVASAPLFWVAQPLAVAASLPLAILMYCGVEKRFLPRTTVKPPETEPASPAWGRPAPVLRIGRDSRVFASQRWLSRRLRCCVPPGQASLRKVSTVPCRRPPGRSRNAHWFPRGATQTSPPQLKERRLLHCLASLLHYGWPALATGSTVRARAALRLSQRAALAPVWRPRTCRMP